MQIVIKNISTNYFFEQQLCFSQILYIMLMIMCKPWFHIIELVKFQLYFVKIGVIPDASLEPFD